MIPYCLLLSRPLPCPLFDVVVVTLNSSTAVSVVPATVPAVLAALKILNEVIGK